MAKELKLPDVGENVEKATVLSVSIKAGQTIAQDDIVIEIETDKASLEVPAEVGGTVSEVRVAEGDEISPGDVIAVLEGESAGEEKRGKKDEKKPAGQEKEDEEEASPKPEEEESEEEPEEEETEEKPGAQKKKPSRPGGSKTRSSAVRAAAPPSVRRLARELGVEIADVEGSGDGGRISDEDVKRHVREMLQTGAGRSASRAQPAGTAGAAALPDFEKWGPVRREKLSGIRNTIAQRMSQSWTSIPHVHHFDEADITLIEASRQEYNELRGDGGGRISLTAILMKIVARVLQDYPDITASIDPSAGEIVYKDFCHIAMAVDTPRGLMAPVIRDVDRKTIPDLAADVVDAARRARDGQLKREDMQGGVFTITNLGAIGGVQFTPIINPPDAAILGVSQGQFRVAMHDDHPEERLVLPLSLGYDHRIIDGATAARFMRDLAGFLSNPVLSLLGL